MTARGLPEVWAFDWTRDDQANADVVVGLDRNQWASS